MAVVAHCPRRSCSPEPQMIQAPTCHTGDWSTRRRTSREYRTD
jgi:hypothetical protein